MSDTVIIEIIKVVGILASVVLTAWLNHRFSRMHKQMNGRMDELLEMKRKEGMQDQKDKKK